MGLLSLSAFGGYAQFAASNNKFGFLLDIGLHRSTPRSNILEIGNNKSTMNNKLELMSFDRQRNERIAIEMVNSNDTPSMEEYIQASKIFYKYITNDSYF